MARLVDLTGKKFGKWSVIKRDLSKVRCSTHWICKCACGLYSSVKAHNLTSGRSTQCKQCHDSTLNRRHGMYKSPEYRTWEGMIGRCTNPNNSAFSYYGGRGITVCNRWRENFVHFFEDMGYRPKGKSLDRIDNEKGYFPENCRWASRVEQSNNTRMAHEIGSIFKNWKLIEKIPRSKLGVFQCTECTKEKTCEIYYITSLRGAACKCK